MRSVPQTGLTNQKKVFISHLPPKKEGSDEVLESTLMYGKIYFLFSVSEEGRHLFQNLRAGQELGYKVLIES